VILIKLEEVIKEEKKNGVGLNLKEIKILKLLKNKKKKEFKV